MSEQKEQNEAPEVNVEEREEEAVAEQLETVEESAEEKVEETSETADESTSEESAEGSEESTEAEEKEGEIDEHLGNLSKNDSAVLLIDLYARYRKMETGRPFAFHASLFQRLFHSTWLT